MLHDLLHGWYIGNACVIMQLSYDGGKVFGAPLCCMSGLNGNEDHGALGSEKPKLCLTADLYGTVKIPRFSKAVGVEHRSIKFLWRFHVIWEKIIKQDVKQYNQSMNIAFGLVGCMDLYATVKSVFGAVSKTKLFHRWVCSQIDECRRSLPMGIVIVYTFDIQVYKSVLVFPYLYSDLS
jgi:hypothetical protein